MNRSRLDLWGQWAICAAVLVLLAAAPAADGGVVITECGTGDPDFAEIQNLSSSAVDTSGWFVAANNASDAAGPPDINTFHSTLWYLPASRGCRFIQPGTKGLDKGGMVIDNGPAKSVVRRPAHGLLG